MRKRGWVLGALLIAGAVALVGLRTEDPRSEAPPAPARASTVEPASRPSVAPQAPRPTGTLRIRGTVVDVHGRPVAAARVSAFSPEPGHTLSELPCPPAEWEHPEAPGGRKLAECLSEVAPLLLELAGARQGEAPLKAEATTATDGTFTLEGLPEGALVLWAQDGHGAAMRAGIPAGTEGVELVLEPGDTLEGTVRGEGAPLAGARVTALSLRHTRFFDTTTGADGRYHLGPLPPGTYALLVTKEDWLPELLLPEAEEGRLLEDVRLLRPRQLTGQVWSASRAPAPGVQVRVGPGRTLPGPTSRTVTTDAEGRFALQLRPGRHTLTAESEGRSAMVRVQLSNQPPPHVVLKLGSALHVHGQVLDDARHPVAGVSVELESPTNHGLSRKASTDAQGRYAMGPMEPGSWRFSLRAPRYQDREGFHYTLTPRMGPMDFTLLQVPTVEGRVTDTTGLPLPRLRVQLTRSDTFQSAEWTDAEGRFVLDADAPGAFQLGVAEEAYLHEPILVSAPARDVHLTVSPGASVVGTLLDSRGLPLEDFAVMLAGMDVGPESARQVVTDAHGRFSFQGLKPGAYRLLAHQPSDGLERKAWREVELREEAPVELELRLPEERALSGLVVDEQGQPVAGGSVHARVPRGDEPKWLQNFTNGTGTPGGARTDKDGRFTLRHLTARRYLLKAEAPGHAFLPERSAGGEAREGSVLASTDAAGVRLVMKRKPHVTGRVVGPEGAPVTRFWVDSIEYESPEGNFAVPIRDEQGADSFTFAAEMLLPRRMDVQGRGDADVGLGVVRLERGRTVRIQVLDAHTSQPLADALIMFTFSDTTGETFPIDGAARTDADGTFAVHPLTARPYTLRVTSVGDAYQTLFVEVAESQRELTLRLAPRDAP